MYLSPQAFCCIICGVCNKNIEIMGKSLYNEIQILNSNEFYTHTERDQYAEVFMKGTESLGLKAFWINISRIHSGVDTGTGG